MNPLTLLFALAFLVSVDMRILTPVLPSISFSLGSSPGIVGLAMTTYAIAYGTGQLFYGPLSDRLSRIAVVRAAGIGFAVCTFLSGLAVTTGQFIAARLLAGAFAGAVIPLTLVYIGDTVPYQKRQIVLGYMSVVASSALAFSASIGGTIAHFVSWRLMLIGYSVLALVPIALMWRLETQAVCPQSGCGEGYGVILRNRRALFIYASVFLEGFLLWGPMNYIGAFAIGRYGFDQFVVGLLIAFFGIGTMAGGLLMGKIRGFLSETGLAAWGGILMGVPYLCLIPRWPAAVFVAGLLLLGLGFVCLHTTLQLRGTEISAAARGKAFSVFIFCLFTGISAGSAFFGRLVDADRYETMLLIAGIGLIGVGLATAYVPAEPGPRRAVDRG
ncbi:MAG: MFS transporter [Deltaproteobacteria bacterium]|nr:MFS transporter [Deltaproteobacteria bacterium]